MKLTTYLHKPISQSWLTESNSLLVHLEYSFFILSAVLVKINTIIENATE